MAFNIMLCMPSEYYCAETHDRFLISGKTRKILVLATGFFLKKESSRNSLAVQWLGLHAFTV